MCLPELTRRAQPERQANLTERERDVLTYLASGYRNDRIAHAMQISKVTVDFHIRNARCKLSARTREEAVARAIKAGLIEI